MKLGRARRCRFLGWRGTCTARNKGAVGVPLSVLALAGWPGKPPHSATSSASLTHTARELRAGGDPVRARPRGSHLSNFPREPEADAESPREELRRKAGEQAREWSRNLVVRGRGQAGRTACGTWHLFLIKVRAQSGYSRDAPDESRWMAVIRAYLFCVAAACLFRRQYRRWRELRVV